MIEGYMEALRTFQVRGWAVDLANPQNRVRVRVKIDGRQAATGIADLYREDLVSAKIGDGRHAFVLNVAEAIPLERPHAVTAEALLDDGSCQQLPPIGTLVIEAIRAEAPGRTEVTMVTGYYTAGPASVSGWAYDAARPDQPIMVEIETAGQTLATIVADIFRPDLAQAGIGRGGHGFVFHATGTPLDPAATIVHGLTAESRRVKLGLEVAHAGMAAVGFGRAAGPAFPSAFVDEDQYPVFILGAARSGTSAMAQALAASGTYLGFDEGHFVDVLAPLSQALSQFYQNRADEWTEGRSTHLSALPQSFVEQGLRHILVQAARTSFPGGRWVDKTPHSAMIAIAPALRAVWPNARFIYMRRRAIENIESRLRKFPGSDLQAHCCDWALSLRTWYSVAEALRGAAIEIDQVYMARHPAEVTAALHHFLDLPREALARVAQALVYDQPERTATHFGAVSAIEDVGWTERERTTVESICGPAMREAGYGTGTTYFQNDDTSHGLILL